jgi:hypothetical protein
MRSLFFGLAMICALLGATVPSASAATSNEQAAQQIASNLKQSGKLKGYRVGVKYEDGVAWLTGTVTSERQLQIAQQIARNTEGVDHVICKLEVESGNENFETPASYQEREPSRSQGVPSKPSAQRNSMPVPYAYTSPQGVQAAAYSQSQQAQYCPDGGYAEGGGMAPMGMSHTPGGSAAAVNYDNPQMPGYAWPSYAASPNYAALTYPQQYSASAWPYIGPFYPYPQVPLGWRKVTLEWDDGWWFLDFKDSKHCK